MESTIIYGSYDKKILHYIIRIAVTLLLITAYLLLPAAPARAGEMDKKLYGIMTANAKGGYTFYDLNDDTEGNAAIEITEAGNVMVPLKELAAKIPGLTYRYDKKKNTATVTNTGNGRKIIYSKGSKKLSYYSSSKAKAVKKSMVYQMYLSEDSGAVMVHMQSLKWVMGTTSGFAYYKPAQMQAKGYDTYTYSGLLLYNSYKTIGELPSAPKVYGISSITKVTIPEGYSVSQTFDLLVKKGVCTSTKALYDAMENYEFSKERYPLYAAIEDNEERCFKLEGYLFPDTYEFNLLSKPEDAIGKFLRNAEVKITEADRLKAQELGMSMNEILTIASIIEKENPNQEERPLISSVIHNRLAINMPLQMDCTINYVERYIKPYISGDLNRYNSYYNTYKCPALPAGPICNPGKAAIQAALNPASTDYLYFYSDADGKYHFSHDYVNPKALEPVSQDQEAVVSE